MPLSAIISVLSGVLFMICVLNMLKNNYHFVATIKLPLDFLIFLVKLIDCDKVRNGWCGTAATNSIWRNSLLLYRKHFGNLLVKSRDVNGTRFSRVPKKFPVPGKKIPERENFGKLRTTHRYKIRWQQFVSQWTPHNGHCPTPGGVRWAASFRSQ